MLIGPTWAGPNGISELAGVRDRRSQRSLKSPQCARARANHAVPLVRHSRSSARPGLDFSWTLPGAASLAPCLAHRGSRAHHRLVVPVGATPATSITTKNSIIGICWNKTGYRRGPPIFPRPAVRHINLCPIAGVLRNSRRVISWAMTRGSVMRNKLTLRHRSGLEILNTDRVARYHHFYASVALPARGCVIGCHRISLSKPNRTDRPTRYSLFDEVIAYRIGALLGEFHHHIHLLPMLSVWPSNWIFRPG